VAGCYLHHGSRTYCPRLPPALRFFARIAILGLPLSHVRLGAWAFVLPDAALPFTYDLRLLPYALPPLHTHAPRAHTHHLLLLWRARGACYVVPHALPPHVPHTFYCPPLPILPAPVPHTLQYHTPAFPTGGLFVDGVGHLWTGSDTLQWCTRHGRLPADPPGRNRMNHLTFGAPRACIAALAAPFTAPPRTYTPPLRYTALCAKAFHPLSDHHHAERRPPHTPHHTHATHTTPHTAHRTHTSTTLTTPHHTHTRYHTHPHPHLPNHREDRHGCHAAWCIFITPACNALFNCALLLPRRTALWTPACRTLLHLHLLLPPAAFRCLCWLRWATPGSRCLSRRAAVTRAHLPVRGCLTPPRLYAAAMPRMRMPLPVRSPSPPYPARCACRACGRSRHRLHAALCPVCLASPPPPPLLSRQRGATSYLCSS